MGQFTLSQSAKGSLLALSGVLMFSTKSVFAKMAIAINPDVLTVLFLRIGFGFPIVLMIFIVTWIRNKEKHKMLYKDYIAVFLFAIIGYYMSSLFNFQGLKYITASAERIVLFLYPTFVILMSATFLKQKIKAKQIVAITVCYFGLIIAFSDKLVIDGTGNFWTGVFLVAASAMTYAVFLTASNKYIPRIGPTMFTTLSLLSACIATIIHFSIQNGYAELLRQTDEFYLICGLMSVIGTILPAYMFNTAIKHLGASNVSIISSLGPVETMVMSAMALHEQISLVQVFGTIFVILGVLILKMKFNLPGRLAIKKV